MSINVLKVKELTCVIKLKKSGNPSHTQHLEHREQREAAEKKIQADNDKLL